MALPILMPALSPTMMEGNIVKWHKKQGDKVEPGQIMVEVETDKAIMEIEAVDAGVIGKILIEEKTTGVKVNELIAVLIESDEGEKEIEEIILNHSSSAPNVQQESENKQDDQIPNAEQKSAPEKEALPVAQSNNRIKASPLARKVVAQKGLDITKIKGTGPHGRIVKDDVLNFKDEVFSVVVYGRNPQETSLKSISGVRKVIAERLLESKQNVPHFYVSMDCILDKLLLMRSEINSAAEKKDDKPLYRISVNDFVIKAVAKAMYKMPVINSSWSERGIIQYNNVDIAVAVATESGLITPIVKNADQKSILNISGEMKKLVKRAKENKLMPEEFQGGGFSISNLGMYGVKSFDAIINPPQSCIMAVGAGLQKPMIIDGKIEISTVMNITLSCDHRVVDGAVAAEFLNLFKKFIENPTLMLI